MGTIVTTFLNEMNVNITPNVIIYHFGKSSPFKIYAIKGNGLGLSTSSPWPKFMGNIQNNGHRPKYEAAEGKTHNP